MHAWTMGVGCHALLQGIEHVSLTYPELASEFFTTSATWETQAPTVGTNTPPALPLWRKEEKCLRASFVLIRFYFCKKCFTSKLPARSPSWGFVICLIWNAEPIQGVSWNER